MKRGTRIFQSVWLTVVLTLGVVEGAALGGCAILPGSPGAQPASTLIAGSYSKQSDDLTVKLTTTPSPPIRGDNTIDVFVTDINGQPVSGAKVSFDIDMTNMSHGKNIITASSSGEGHYIGREYFLMPGPWRLIVNIERAGQTNSVRFDFNVNFR